MSTTRVRRVLALFREACELPDAERGAFLSRACGDDDALQSEVESMLAADTADGDDDSATSQRVRSALAGLIEAAQDPALPQSIGGYRIVGLIARGGMGVVYEAVQEHPARRVAIKVARAGHTSDERAKRFALESQLLARLTHPGIAQIIEAGTTPVNDGAEPFFVMEFVDGEPVTQYAAARALGTRAKLELLVRVAEPVAFAHGHAVIHRDLKPDNVLIVSDGSPKVLDFGVAKVEAAGGFGAATMRTEAGRVIGTIGYMAPEQLGGESEALTARADVYSLGVLSYELLTGRLPHDLDGVTLSRALAVVTTTDAPALGVVKPEYRGDIEAVVAKALEKDPRDRYADAGAFKADVERCLRDEPVLARRHSKLHRLRKFSRRNRGLVAGLGATVAALLLGLVVALVFAAGEAEQRGRFERVRAIVQHERLLEALPALDPPWPRNTKRIEQWLADCDALLDQRTDLEQTLQQLKSVRGDASRFLEKSLARLRSDLERLEAETRPAVRERLTWARAVGVLTAAHPNARVSWAEARAASPVELRAEDMIGLVPIGANPKTGLWEFYHLRSAWDGASDPRSIPIPEQRPDGTIDVKASTGIVFVLVPGGGFWMGTQKESEKLPNYDSKARVFAQRAGLAHRVELGPFLVSKYELTQGQWARLSGGDRPSYWHTGSAPGEYGRPAPVGDDRHPVEQVNWNACDTLLGRYGLTIPTEAQWEYACRAGTTTPWSTGKTRASLKGHANLQDQSAVRGWPRLKRCEAFDDGFLGTAPVGRYLPNRFGLHDMHGNVAEWVREKLPCPYTNEPRAGDGFRSRTPDTDKARLSLSRGGCFMDLAPNARSAQRRDAALGMVVAGLGIRPARELRL